MPAGWFCPEPDCHAAFAIDYGDGPCPHCKDPLGKVSLRTNDYRGKPHGWIQHKGSDLCMDVHCSCGAHMHIDDDFVYYVECPYCGKVWAVSGYVELVELTPSETEAAKQLSVCKLLEKDDEDQIDYNTF